ncbi:hypothetical protein M8C21_020445, partial [Ambrosia artemisiifolia]
AQTLLPCSPIFSSPPLNPFITPFVPLSLSLSLSQKRNTHLTMLPHTYPTTDSTHLTTLISTATTPHQISTVCTSITLFLTQHLPHQTLHFFSTTFPTLISSLFGYNNINSNSNSWIDILSPVADVEAFNKLYHLFSPSGVLFTSINELDRLSLVKYVFPADRLPEWVRVMLQSGRTCGDLSDLCPLFKDKLSIMEYYLFWFAYYPLCKASCHNTNHIVNHNVNDTAVSSRVSKRVKLESLAYKSVSVIRNVRKRSGNERKNRNGDGECGDLYFRLLNAYLAYFVPLNELNGRLSYGSSLLHYSSSCDTSVFENAEFFVNTLIHFWLVGNDFSPLSVKLCKSFGVDRVVLPLRTILGEVPPADGLGEVVNVFVKYMNSSLVLNGSVDMKYMDVFPSTGSVGYWNSCIQRPVYRYILRTFLFFPFENSLKNVSQVFSLWVNYMEPWAVSLDEVSKSRANADCSKRDSVKEVSTFCSRGYTSSWQGYVLSNYLFYSSLVMHFIGFAHKFVHTDPELVVQMVSKVVNVLTSSTELLDLIKNVDTVFHSSPAGSSKSLSSLYRFVPSIREQLQDWEDGLSETDADGSFLHESWNKDLKLFSTSEDGGQQLLQLLVLRAESELQAISSENLHSSLRLLASLKAQMGCLFGGNVIPSPTPPESSKLSDKSRHEVFRPKTAGNRPTTDIRYKGDWMKRPISNDEVAWLANLLVKLSWWLNDILGLNSWENGDVGPSTWSYVEVRGDAGAKVFRAKDTSRLGREAVKLMRQHGIRVNLRMFASKKIVLVLLIAIAYSAVKRMFW